MDDVIEINGVAYHGHEIESAVEELPFVEPAHTVVRKNVSVLPGADSLTIGFRPRSGVSSDLERWRIVEHVFNRFGARASRVHPVAGWGDDGGR